MKKIITGTIVIIAVAILTITLFGGKSMAKTKLSTHEQHIAQITADYCGSFQICNDWERCLCGR